MDPQIIQQPRTTETARAAGSFQWLHTGAEFFPPMLAAIETARSTIRFEMYIYTASPLGEQFRNALVRARQRGVRVQVLNDALGSFSLPQSFWDPLVAAGGEFRWFNPFNLGRLIYRDHRKILVCDEKNAFIGGYNIAPEYQGDGVTHGWRDLGMQVTGPLARELARSFDDIFLLADFQHKRFTRLRKRAIKDDVVTSDGELLLSGPGRGPSPVKQALIRDLIEAKTVRIISAYFLPTWRIRQELTWLARRKRPVQLIVAAKSDVLLSRLACQRLYSRLLRAGIEIYEYQPQILHAKLIVIDDIVYVGSANLDTRSLNINYELLVRVRNRGLAGQAREIFAGDLQHCKRIDAATWRTSRTLWQKIKERWAYFILAKVDPYVARLQLKTLR
jgi:cardiolipin synthase A/B